MHAAAANAHAAAEEQKTPEKNGEDAGASSDSRRRRGRRGSISGEAVGKGQRGLYTAACEASSLPTAAIQVEDDAD